MKITIKQRELLSYRDLQPGDVFRLSTHTDAALLMRVNNEEYPQSHVNLSTGGLHAGYMSEETKVFSCDCELIFKG